MKPRIAPHIYRDCVNALLEVAITYHGSGQLRARLNSVLKKHIEPPLPPHTRTVELDAVDIFADQVIGTKTKIIRMPAPLGVPQEGIRVYLNADELFMYLEKQGYIVLIEKH